MKIVLVGGPGIGKSKLAQELTKHIQIGVMSGIPATPTGAALGALADYRTELFLASYRAHGLIDEGTVPILYRTSLVDSAAYVSMRLAGMSLRPVLPDEEVVRWEFVLSAVTLMMRDSWDADLVFQLPWRRAGYEHYEDAVTAMQLDILNNLDQEFVTLDGTLTENAELIATMVRDAAALT